MDMTVLRDYKIADPFWGRLRGLVRREMLPYQWEALNDRVEGAAPSFCVHNFLAAARLNGRRAAGDPDFREPVFAYPGFEVWPEAGEEPDPDKFYGFVFQDSDLYKWLEAASYCLMDGPDPELEAMAARAAELICAAQHPSGYLDTYYILNGMDAALTDLGGNHELYCLGHLIEGAVAYFEATGRDGVLNAARRYADFIYEKMGPGGPIPGLPGHELAEMALARLYELTGEERYLALAKLFIDRRGRRPDFFEEERRALAARRGGTYRPDPDRAEYRQSHLPVREQREAVGHAVRAMYLYSGMADVARICGDAGLWEACRELWQSVTGEKMYITGGVGGTSRGEAFSYPFDLPNDAAYAETCAVVGLVFFARRMLEAEGGGEYADVMERALYNAVLSGVALDGHSFFYVNPLEVSPEALRRDRRLSHVKAVRQKWFGCACCPPNLARLVSSVGAYAARRRGGELRLEMYIGGEISARLDGGTLKVMIESGLPWHGDVTLSVTSKEPVRARLALRLPRWTDPEGVEIAASNGAEPAREGGYMVLSGLWQPGDRVTLRLPMPVRVLSADPRVRECAGLSAVQRGPIVYCAEEADNGPGLQLWRLDSRGLDGIVPVETEISGVPVTALDVPALRRPGRADGLYTPCAPPDETPGTLRLIPYFAWANRGEGEMRVWLRV